MAVSTKETTDVNAFHRELIDRFFNPKSYFLFSFIADLKNRESLLEKPENVAAIGLVVDEIINSENKFEKILDLTRIPGFDFFYHTLMEKVEYLRVAQLTTQQMMETVKTLGVTLAEAFEQIMADAESRAVLLEHVGIVLESGPASGKPVSEAEIEESTSQVEESPIEKKIDLSQLDNLFAGEKQKEQSPDPWDFFYEDVNGKLNQIDDLLNAFEQAPNDRALLSQIKANFQELREWAMIQGNEGIETIAMRLLIALNLALRTFSYRLGDIIPHVREAIQALREVNKFGWAGENLDIIPVVIRHLELLYSEIKNSAHPSAEAPPHAEQPFSEEPSVAEPERKAEPNPVGEKSQPDQETPEEISLEKDANSSKIEAQLQEFEDPAPEPPTPDRQPEEMRSEIPPEEPALQETDSEEEFEEILVDSDFDLETLQEEVASGEQETPPEETVEEQEPEPIADESPSVDELSETVSEMEKLYQEMFPEEFEEEPAPQAEAPEEESRDESIRDWNQPEEPEMKSPQTPDVFPPAPETDNPAPEGKEELYLPGEEDDDLRQIMEEIAAEEEPVSQNPVEPKTTAEGEPVLKAAQPQDTTAGQAPLESAQKAVPPKISAPLLQRGGKDLVEEAEMYFQFTQKAFASLEKNPGLHRSFEDIELACYSLKILARKLGYLHVAKIAEKIEEIFKQVLSGELLLKPEQIGYLSTVMEALKKRGMENRLSDEKISAWAADVLKKMDQIQAVVPDVHQSVKPEDIKSEEPEEDPLEFLMYEDTGKYFKQLLDD